MQLASWSIESNPDALRKLWIAAIEKEIEKITAKIDSVPTGTVVERFLAQLPKSNEKSGLVHPRGDSRETAIPVEEDGSDGGESDSVASSSSDDGDTDRLVLIDVLCLAPGYLTSTDCYCYLPAALRRVPGRASARGRKKQRPTSLWLSTEKRPPTFAAFVK